MLGLFDKAWSDNQGKSWEAIQEWKKYCEVNGWTDDEFDQALDRYTENVAINLEKVA
jgi:hypothetical protein